MLVLLGFSQPTAGATVEQHIGNEYHQKDVRRFSYSLTFTSKRIKSYVETKLTSLFLLSVYKRGLPQVRVPLPSTNQECLFTFRPVTNTVGDFLHMIQREDQAIESISVATK
ncbi:unnamed protein product, partial [Nesidiocoris tenuis]